MVSEWLWNSLWLALGLVITTLFHWGRMLLTSDTVNHLKPYHSLPSIKHLSIDASRLSTALSLPTDAINRLPPLVTERTRPLIILIDPCPDTLSHYAQLLEPHFRLLLMRSLATNNYELHCHEMAAAVLGPNCSSSAIIEQLQAWSIDNRCPHVPTLILSKPVATDMQNIEQSHFIPSVSALQSDVLSQLQALIEQTQSTAFFPHDPIQQNTTLDDQQYRAMENAPQNSQVEGVVLQINDHNSQAFDQKLKQQSALLLAKHHISVEALARRLGMSVRSLQRKVQHYYGISCREYIKQYQFLVAKNQLRQGDSVKQAAINAGFVSPSHFSRQFKRQFGLTPSDYRQQAE